MATIRINFTNVISAAGTANSAKSRLNSARNNIINNSSGLDYSIKQRANIGNRINTLSNNISYISTIVSSVVDVCNRGANTYKNADLNVLKSVSKISSSNVGNFTTATAGAAGLFVANKSSSIKTKFIEYDDKKGLNDKFKKLPKQDKKDGKQINKDEKFYNKKGTIAEAKGEKKVEGSIWDKSVSGNSKYAEGSAQAKALTAEAHANAAAGLYVYEKDKNGNTKRIFSPGVSAEVGASGSVLDASAKGRVGLGKDKNMLGAYGEAEVKAVSGEAKAGVAINRKEVHASASAEVNAVKATASGGVSVLGTDVGVKGSVKVGVGAHADIGYTDGKFKFDVGAALGVGVDVGFEVDVGGTVDAVYGAVKSAWNKWFV